MRVGEPQTLLCQAVYVGRPHARCPVAADVAVTQVVGVNQDDVRLPFDNGGLDKPTSGKVFIDEVDIAQLDAYELAWLRCRKIGYIFQTFNIIQVMTALENVTLPMIFAGMNNDQAVEKGLELLKLVGLGDRFRHKPFELSGGQQQRVAVARALANDPAIILADEPTGNLDLTTGEEIIDLLKHLSRERNVTVISATHDIKMLNVSDQVVWIRDGQIDKIEDREELSISVGQIDIWERSEH